MGTTEAPDNHTLLKTYALAFVIYLAITLVMFWPISLNPLHTTVNAAFRNSDIYGGDVFGSLWNLWWASHAILTSHTSVYFTNMLFYPLGSDLSTHTLAPLEGIMTLPFQPLGLVFRYNLIFVLGYSLSGLFMFMLAYFFVHDKYASFIAGLIYAFAPINIAQNYAHLTWASYAFVPLFILLFFLTLEKKRVKYPIAAALALLLIIFFGDLEIGIMTTFFVLLMLFYLAVTRNERFSISIKSVAYVVAIFAFVLLLGFPFFAPILRSMIYSNAINTASADSNVFESIQLSNNVLSFFLPSYYNFAFNNVSNLYYNDVFSPDLNEKVAYLGYSVIALIILAIIYTRNTKTYKDVKLWIFGAVSFGLMSLGPLVQVSKYVLPIPGPYLLYGYVPLFNLVAEPGRFDLIAVMCIAVLAAIGFKKLSSMLLQRSRNAPKAAFALAMIFVILVLVEYNGMPNLGMSLNLFMKPKVPKAYSIIAQKPGNYSVLILPDMRDNVTNYLYPGMEMYFQTVFQRPIFGGYVSKITPEEAFSTYPLPLSLQSKALQDNYSNISQAYPILENYTYTDMVLAKMYNISFIAVIKSAYGSEEYATLNSYISAAFGLPIYASNSTVLYSTSAVSNRSFEYPTAYVEGPWYLANGTWWANGTSSVTIYSSESTSAEISMNIIGHNTTAYDAYVCLDGKPIKMILLNTSFQPFATGLKVKKGTNRLTLSANGSCSSAYVLWGTRNISFN